MKKKVYKYVLSVDFEGGDYPDYFEIPKGRGVDTAMANVKANFPHMLFASYPPPKIEVLGLTKGEWTEAKRRGKEDE